jgi:hypothetical protein
MKPRVARTAYALVAIVATLLAAGPVAATAVSGLSTVSGYAYGESVDVTALSLVHVTSGPLPEAGPLASSGGTDSNSAASVCAPLVTCSVLSTGLLEVATTGTTGAAGTVSSTASVLNVSALGGLVTGQVVASQCQVDSNGGTSGSSTLTNVTINGVVVASNPGPNTSLLLVDAGNVAAGHVILNEQTYDSGLNRLTVNAIHIKLDVANGSLGTGDIIISHVECDASPAGPAPVIPESPFAVLLPLSGILLAGGLLLIGRRQLALDRR